MPSLPFDEQKKAQFLAQIKQSGQVFIYPTETYYALGCLATDDIAIKKIYQFKQRPIKLPLLVLIANMRQLQQHCPTLTPTQLSFLETVWPSALTVILPSRGLSPHLNSTNTNIAFRMPPHTEIRDLIQSSNAPWVGTSANLNGSPSLNHFKAVQQIFNQKIDLWIDGGDCPGGQPSTLIYLGPKGEINLLRQGQVQLG